jgi:hypothetical protein
MLALTFGEIQRNAKILMALSWSHALKEIKKQFPRKKKGEPPLELNSDEHRMITAQFKRHFCEAFANPEILSDSRAIRLKQEIEYQLWLRNRSGGTPGQPTMTGFVLRCWDNENKRLMYPTYVDLVLGDWLIDKHQIRLQILSLLNDDETSPPPTPSTSSSPS